MLWAVDTKLNFVFLDHFPYFCVVVGQNTYSILPSFALKSEKLSQKILQFPLVSTRPRIHIPIYKKHYNDPLSILM